jgi:pyruvate dehydrogenase E2 component (dihydrolipoamide acetyltransferase)
VGSTEGPASASQGPIPSEPTASPASSKATEEPPEVQGVEGEARPAHRGEGTRVKASPLARRLALEADIDLQSVRGSGPGGRIVMTDIEAAKSGERGASVAGGEAPLHALREAGIDFEDRPLSQMRKAVARRLVESLGPVPHFFLRISVDMSRTLGARTRVNELLKGEGGKVSVNDFILKATAHALKRHPEVNAQWMGDGIRRHFRVHLGVAVAVEDGLITPVIRDANEKGLAEISREVRELAARGREKRLRPEEYSGSTFSVSNLGMFGIHEFTGVINPPEAGILAVGAIEDTPVAEDGQVVVRHLMKVTMSCDHRVIDGATGAGFLRTLKEMLEEPAAILV